MITYYFHIVLTHGDKRLVRLQSIDATTLDQAEHRLMQQLGNYRAKCWSISIVSVPPESYERLLAGRWKEIDDAATITVVDCWRCEFVGASDVCTACGGKRVIDLGDVHVDEIVFDLLTDIEKLENDRDHHPYLPNGYYFVHGMEFLLSSSGAISISSVACQACYRRLHGFNAAQWAEQRAIEVQQQPRKRFLDRVMTWILGGAA